MRYVCDAPGGKTWFLIETEAEAAFESKAMEHAVEKHFRHAQREAAKSYVPPSGAFVERDIRLKAHIQRVMPMFLTLRDREGKALATAMLPPLGRHDPAVKPVIVAFANGDPYPDHGQAIGKLGEHFGLTLDAARCYRRI